ncbi:EamA/RhaT family transporter [Legionella taurinensis]|uniref:DMT family transporter n=1 Tax=Legionella taurinensis TaxID=70611 RepID=A0A3A5L5L1_9GAMM|nr:DMT family transporter [Legionella taurinensis]MDX1837350.1 DMT family transporter [Legionella taurinensis]PUT40908.1 EamA family transporter [Legionella taurinensis]PUT44330.1 EamA family transporter [Legionella taurinensis]PUT47610.1 EamA family transporter [Legionella taurinensis]PUT48771.1 EamA family transporter [Legionella taurinensis]
MPRRLLPFLWLIAAQTMVAVNIVCSKYLLTHSPAWFLLLLRFSLAALLLLPLHWLTPARKRTVADYFQSLPKGQWFLIIAQALSAGLLFNCLLLLGLHYTHAAAAGIITSALPAIISLLAFIFLKETLSQQKIASIALACLGLVCLAGNSFHASHHSLRGDALIFLSLLPEAAYYLLCQWRSVQLPVFLLSALMNGINALLLLPVGLLNWPSLRWHPLLAALVLLLGLSSGLFYVFWYFGSRRNDATLASLSTALMPVATSLIAWAALGERLSMLQLTGMSLVMLSIFIYARKQ